MSSIILTVSLQIADLTFNFNQMPFGIVANYYLADVSPANGSTELWIGSHRNTSFADCRNCTEEPSTDFGIRSEPLEERRAYAPPIQPTVKKGSAVLRDLRLWHAGLSNPSKYPRVMLAFVHTPWVSVVKAAVVIVMVHELTPKSLPSGIKPLPKWFSLREHGPRSRHGLLASMRRSRTKHSLSLPTWTTRRSSSRRISIAQTPATMPFFPTYQWGTSSRKRETRR